MAKLKYFFMTMLVMLVSTAMVSCGDDEGDIDDVATRDYYIEATASGGGFNSSQLRELETLLNNKLQTLHIEDVSEKTAKLVFDTFISELKSQWSNGISDLTEPLRLTFKLKTGSKTIKTATITVTSTGVK